MSQREISFLDVLALLGGGGNGTLAQVNPHLLAAFFWATLCVYQFCIRKSYGSRSDDLLMVAFVAACLVETMHVSSALAHASGVGNAFLGGPLWPPFTLLMNAASTILIAAAFMQFLIKSRESTVQFLVIALALVAMVHAYIASKWLMTLQADPQADIATQRYIWIAHITTIIILTIAIANSVLSKQPRRRWIISGFLLLQISLVLTILGSQLDSHQAQMVAPVNGCLQLAAIGFFAYSALSLHVMTEKRIAMHVKSSRKLETIGLLSSGIAHDFNSLLQIIVGYVELAKSQTDNKHPSHASLLHVEDAAQRACSLIGQLLSFELLKDPEFERVDLNQTITQLEPLLSRLLGDKISIEYDLDSNLRPVQAEIHSLEQIILNLADNAKDAMDGEGTIIITTQALIPVDSTHDTHSSNLGTQLIVADTGQGMDEQTADHIFEPFFTTKPKGKGTGLGMAIVSSAVQKYGGRVYVQSEPGLYTQVIVEFPEADTSVIQNQNTPYDNPSYKARGQTILLAQSALALSDLLSSLLQSLGYNTITAVDGQDAVKIASTTEQTIDLCLLDAEMPVINGYQVYEQIRESRPDIPVLFMMATPAGAPAQYEFYPHVRKPFTRKLLLENIVKALESAKKTVSFS